MKGKPTPVLAFSTGGIYAAVWVPMLTHKHKPFQIMANYFHSKSPVG